MSVEITERRVDEKRRVTLPSILGFKEGSKIIMIASPDSAIIASDRQIAENLAKLLHKLEVTRKLAALEEWEKLVDEAGLSSLSSEKINRAVAKRIRRSKLADATEAGSN